MTLKVTDFLELKKNVVNNIIKDLPIRGTTQVDTHKQSIFLQNYLIANGYSWQMDSEEGKIHDFWTIDKQWFLVWNNGDISCSSFIVNALRTPFVNYYDYFYE